MAKEKYSHSFPEKFTFVLTVYVYNKYFCKKRIFSGFHCKGNTGFSYLLADSKISYFTKIKFQVYFVNKTSNFTGKCQNDAGTCKPSY